MQREYDVEVRWAPYFLDPSTPPEGKPRKPQTRPDDPPTRIEAMGEELGLQEADIAFEDLRDPYGIRFWPGFKGRDGCRTPMPWEADRPNAGFSTAKPWLPVPEDHRSRKRAF